MVPEKPKFVYYGISQFPWAFKKDLLAKCVGVSLLLISIIRRLVSLLTILSMVLIINGLSILTTFIFKSYTQNYGNIFVDMLAQ